MLRLDVYKHILSLLKERPIFFGGDPVAPRATARTFSDGTQCIHVITREEDCKAVLTHPDFRQHDFTGLVRKMMPSGDTSCIASEFLVRNPINLNGDAHKEARQEFLKTFNALRKSARAEFREVAKRTLAELAGVEHGASVTRSVTAYVDGVVCRLLAHLRSDAPDPDLWEGSAACIFEFFPSSARLKKKDDQVGRVLAATKAAPASESLDTAMMLSFLLQGRDPLLGGLSAFLGDLAASSPEDRGAKLGRADGRSIFRDAAPVNYIGRVATRDIRIGDLHVAQGDEVVIVLPWASANSDRGGLAFGAGAHVCAGQALSIDIADCWLDELRSLQDTIAWDRLPVLKYSPAVFQQFEELIADDTAANH